MATLTLRLPDVTPVPRARPVQCPHCGWKRVQRWATCPNPVRDTTVRHVTTQHYRWCRCRRSWRVDPDGVDRATQTLRLRPLAALLWTLGVSLRAVVARFAAFDVVLTRMSVLRDVHALAATVHHQRQARRVRVLGVDGAWVAVRGQPHGVVVAVDRGTGLPVAVAHLDEKDPAAVIAWRAPRAERRGVAVMVTDDLARYNAVAEQVGVDQQVCLWHLRRWVGRARHPVRAPLAAAWHPLLDQIQALVRTLPRDGGYGLLELWQQVPQAGAVTRARTALDNLRQLLARLQRDWQSSRLARQHTDVPTTTNGTDQAMGRFKVRSRRMRGLKAWSGVETTMLLTRGSAA